MALRVKNVNLNTKNKFKGRILAVGHNGMSGLGGCAVINNYAEASNLDCMVQVDVNDKTTMTDRLIEKSIESIDNLSLKMFDEVYIVGRSTCSEAVLRKLFKWGVKRVIHIDSHLKNTTASKVFARDFDMYEYISSTEYSSCWVTYKYVTEVCHHVDSAPMKSMCALIDAWDTFKWTSSNDPVKDPLGAMFIEKEYNISKVANVGEINLLPFDSSVIALSYVFKFEESISFFRLLTELIKYGTGLKEYRIVVNRFRKMEERTIKYIQYAYNDTMKGLDSRSKVFRVNVPQDENPEAKFSVFYVDKALDYEVASIAAHFFLQKYTNLILIYKTKELAATFSVRSTGNINITPILKKFGGNGNPNAGGFNMVEVEEILNTRHKVVSNILRRQIK